MDLDDFDESLHTAEYLFAHLLPIFLFTGMGHFNAEFIHLPDKLFGRIDAMIETVLADLDDTADPRLCSVPQQDPVDGKVNIGLHAGGVREDFIEAQGRFSVKQLARNHGIRGGPVIS